jgi:hypothetical protein
MVEGVVVAGRLRGADALTIRDELLVAVSHLLEHELADGSEDDPDRSAA